jgi:hypothetical protein
MLVLGLTMTLTTVITLSFLQLLQDLYVIIHWILYITVKYVKNSSVFDKVDNLFVQKNMNWHVSQSFYIRKRTTTFLALSIISFNNSVAGQKGQVFN